MTLSDIPSSDQAAANSNLPGKIEKLKLGMAARPLWARMLAPFLAGSLTVLAMPPWSVWAALWFGFTAFYILLSWTETKKATFWCGWLFGFGFFIFGLAWTARALTVEGSSFSWVIPIAIAGLPALLSLFTGAAALASRRLTNMATLPGFVAFAGFATLAEWLRGHVLSGFPWNLYGYGWAEVGPIAQSASLFGAYGLTFMTVLWGSLPGFLAITNQPKSRKIIVTVAVYATLAAAFFWGQQRLDQHPTQYNPHYLLRIVQPSISQTMKWDAKKTIESFRQTVRAAQLDTTPVPKDSTVLMIWPETAVQQDVMEDASAIDMLKEIFSHYPDNFYLATGLLRWEPHGNAMSYFNSIGIYDRNINLLETYDKSHLVPFGEYIPLSRWLPANPLVSMEGFDHGRGASTIGVPPVARDPFQISPMICYEVIFPNAIVEKKTRPGLLLNVTNDGWYGDSAGPRQHLQIARFRAIEEGVPMARSANTGISAVIDPYGRILWRSRIFEVTAKTIGLPMVAPGLTLYRRAGDSIFFLMIFISCMFGLAHYFFKRIH